jgi:uncharacterized membrane protein YsdA (DUF1294 family)
MGSYKLFFILVAAGLALLIGGALLWFTSLPFYPVWLATLGVITFLFYGFDKAQSKTGGVRVPEVVLHGLALAGGFLGGWAGRWIFHHKTRKRAFTLILLASTGIYLVIGFLLFLK